MINKKRTCLRWEEVAIERVLDQVGVVDNQRELRKLFYCFFKLGAGWHSYSALTEVYNAEWPRLPRSDLESAVRRDCKRVNREVVLATGGAQPHHDPECGLTSVHGVCQNGNASLVRLEPRLRALLETACDPMAATHKSTSRESNNTRVSNPREVLANMFTSSRKECELLRHALQTTRDKYSKLEIECESLRQIFRQSVAAASLASLQQSI